MDLSSVRRAINGLAQYGFIADVSRIAKKSPQTIFRKFFWPTLPSAKNTAATDYINIAN
jgi:hypothetical protein